MKNLLVIFLMTFVLISCEGPAGPPGQDGFGYWWGGDYTVDSDHWQKKNDEVGKIYYYYEFKVKELTKEIYFGGEVKCYMYLDFDSDAEAKAPMPNTITRKDNKGYTWEETYSYEYTPDGFVIFTVKYGQNLPTLPPLISDFRVILNY